MSKPAISHLPKSFKFALNGIRHAFAHHLSFRIEVGVATFAFLAGLALRINYREWMVVLLIVGVTLAFELINTALETALDYIAREHQLGVKIAKDVAAGAVLVLAITALVTGVIIFAPYVRAWFG